jgi:hypothetical protein
MIPEYYALVGAAVASLGGLYYLFETITGRSQPNRVTWLLWGLLPLITFAAQRVQGVQGLSWVSLAAGLTPILVVVASFANKQAYWRSSRLDYFLMVASLVGLLAWALTKNANLAILFALVADLLAGTPTLIKSFRHPETESWPAYAISALGFAIALLAVQDYNFQTCAFVIYLLIMNSLMASLAVRRPLAAAISTER